jgi:1-acyl-sn-glycerol-3-phosphate acyltransferase
VSEYWRNQQRREITEYQPRIVFKGKRLVRKFPIVKIRPEPAMERPLGPRVAYHILKFVMATLFKLFLRARVYGRENLPREGAAIVVLNHEGYWDAYLAQSLLPRHVAFMAKNTEFKNPLFRYVLKASRSIPVRRYQIDPSSVRNALNWLAQGEPVGIFIEGERSWDGRFLPPKRGTIKFLIKANVPIIPVRIKGSYEVMPRWAHKMQLYPVSLHIGKPFVMDRRNRTIERTSQELLDVLAKLGKENDSAA